ncbi:hypothetical protein S40285_06738 [Stachybotrys chlorohalonatus IBT 40285]|uniref:Uncharacterized protein n=1 Tax=Stachybotrys chlorohalonatus (strain IBT 40285) TaxID=1283841 RepID=A0A084QJD7_STAC4|nr:hypothetical protein S40285_06738 [Stachybotrys chlorohalonata IBT 40285]
MEQVHGVDVSWMAQGAPKDRIYRSSSPARARPRYVPDSSPSPPRAASPASSATFPIYGLQGGQPEPPRSSSPSSVRGRISRSASFDRQNSFGSTPPQRRGGWFSNISSKFSSTSPPNNASANQQNGQGQSPPPEAEPEPVVPKHSPNKNAVLQHATKHDGSSPYTPAPPKNGQAGFFGVFRRLSSNTSTGFTGKIGNGLVERRVLNVDRHRERCPIMELKDAKLKKVAFNVDVEVAPMPKYTECETDTKAPAKPKKKLTEKGEGEALKNPGLAEQQATADNTGNTGDTASEAPCDGSNEDPVIVVDDACNKETDDATPAKTKEPTRKKEKKKRSEEERKARKEKKRKLAEANGSIPMEILFDNSDASSTASGASTAATFRTTDPARIYRRCCQLRETPILKKITEQLTNSANCSSATGLVNKIDLTNYQMQLPDLITLGDYLAVVPVREISLENSGLTDEGLRVVLAGLLAAKRPDLKRRKPRHNLEEQGGVIERLVLKNNQLGPDGWKHLSLFLYLCRPLKYLDVSNIPFPHQPSNQFNGHLPQGHSLPRGIADVLATALAERPGGSTLELLNMGETEPSMDQLGRIIDGVIACGITRLGLARNHLDYQGVSHLARYLTSGNCEALDLGGNSLQDYIEAIACCIKDTDNLWALSLANCDLTPSSLSIILPKLARLSDFRFIDLSHNRDLFQTSPSAVGLLRRFLPQMNHLKRIHLQDVNMTAEQAIALTEVLPEIKNLNHINLLDNEAVSKLADAPDAEAQEEACALYASLMAAARVSESLVCVDIEVPSDKAGEVVKALAKQVVAYCLRNMERLPDANIGAVAAYGAAESQSTNGKPAQYPDVLAHLVGHDVLEQDSSEDESAPDEDYVIGGTGVVKALTCCLKNKAEEYRRLSADFGRDSEGADKTGGKAKDMSKHLLAGARKIRQRLQPALNKARANPDEDEQNLRKLQFLDNTLQGIIKRFEDEYPDTRQSHDSLFPISNVPQCPPSPPTTNKDQDSFLSDADGSDGSNESKDSKLKPPKSLSRKDSNLSKHLDEEEGRILRAGHRLRAGVLKQEQEQEQLDLLATIDDIGNNPRHDRVLWDLAEDLGGEFLELCKRKGTLAAFREDRALFIRQMQESDPENWPRFVESQLKARENIRPSSENGETPSVVVEHAIAD